MQIDDPDGDASVGASWITPTPHHYNTETDVVSEDLEPACVHGKGHQPGHRSGPVSGRVHRGARDDPPPGRQRHRPHPRAILRDPDPQLLLLKQYRYAADEFLYEIPAGRLEPNEDPADCARRELLEETGCTATDLDLSSRCITTPGFTDERIHVFLASGLARGNPHREVDEFMTLETVTMSQALELIRVGELKDAKSALAILHVAGFRS